VEGAMDEFDMSGRQRIIDYPRTYSKEVISGGSWHRVVPVRPSLVVWFLAGLDDENFRLFMDGNSMSK
jgi:hypothetical protein